MSAARAGTVKRNANETSAARAGTVKRNANETNAAQPSVEETQGPLTPFDMYGNDLRKTDSWGNPVGGDTSQDAKNDSL